MGQGHKQKLMEVHEPGSIPVVPEQPYIRIVRQRGGFVVSGNPSIRLGYEIPSPGGTTEGVFAEWSWDGRALMVTNCRYGMLSLFYFERKDEICVSPSIEKLLELGAPTALDHDALAVFLRLGTYLAEDTPFKAIRTVPPNARFAWRGELQVSGDLSRVEPVRISRDAAIDEFIARFRRAVEIVYRDNCIISLSGGRDSRHILLEVCRIGRPERCITVRNLPPAPDPSDDALCSQLIAQRLGVQHDLIDYVQDILTAELEKNTLTNFTALDHGWYMALRRHIAGSSGIILDGTGGDYLSAGGGTDKASYEFFRRGRLRELAEHLLMRRGNTQRLGYIDPGCFSFAMAHVRLVRELERHADAPNPLGSYLFWNRLRRGLAQLPYGVMRDRIVITPYLNHAVFDLLSGLPVETFIDRGFHIAAILRAFPAVSDVPFEQRRKTPPAKPRRFNRRNLARILAFTLAHRGRILRPSYTVPRLTGAILEGDWRWAWFSDAIIYLCQLERLTRRSGQ